MTAKTIPSAIPGLPPIQAYDNNRCSTVALRLTREVHARLVRLQVARGGKSLNDLARELMEEGLAEAEADLPSVPTPCPECDAPPGKPHDRDCSRGRVPVDTGALRRGFVMAKLQPWETDPDAGGIMSPSGAIRGSDGQPIPSGTVWVKRQQAELATTYGWKPTGVSAYGGTLVQVQR